MGERILMAPSILSADFSTLGAAVKTVEDAGADMIHVDVMDGHFVPNLTIGPPVIKALKQVTDLPLDVHLMIDNADWTVEWYLDAGADMITVHSEGCDHLHRVLQTIRSGGVKAGVSFNPATPIEHAHDVLGMVDMLLIMSVNPGFGGQTFIPYTVQKIRHLSKMCAEIGVSPLIQVDGGIDSETAPTVAEAGARVLVAGSAIFCRDDPGAAMDAIRASAEAVL